jgi:hypothetical protein
VAGAARAADRITSVVLADVFCADDEIALPIALVVAAVEHEVLAVLAGSARFAGEQVVKRLSTVGDLAFIVRSAGQLQSRLHCMHNVHTMPARRAPSTQRRTRPICAITVCRCRTVMGCSMTHWR